MINETAPHEVSNFTAFTYRVFNIKAGSPGQKKQQKRFHAGVYQKW